MSELPLVEILRKRLELLENYVRDVELRLREAEFKIQKLEHPNEDIPPTNIISKPKYIKEVHGFPCTENDLKEFPEIFEECEDCEDCEDC